MGGGRWCFQQRWQWWHRKWWCCCQCCLRRLMIACQSKPVDRETAPDQSLQSPALQANSCATGKAPHPAPQPGAGYRSDVHSIGSVAQHPRTPKRGLEEAKP
eukprot:366427-Chlamydomonas_euryale.AAC.6